MSSTDTKEFEFTVQYWPKDGKPSAKDIKDYVEVAQRIANLIQREVRLMVYFDCDNVVNLVVDVSEIVFTTPPVNPFAPFPPYVQPFIPYPQYPQDPYRDVTVVYGCVPFGTFGKSQE